MAVKVGHEPDCEVDEDAEKTVAEKINVEAEIMVDEKVDERVEKLAVNSTG